MATTKVRAPSGEVITVNHPEGATQAEIIGYAQANFMENPKAQTGVEKYKRTALADDGMTNVAAAFGGALPQALKLGVKGIFNANAPGEVQDWKDSMEGLTSTMGGKIGAFGGAAAPLAAISMTPGANTVLGSLLTGGGWAGLQPVEEGQSRVGNMVRGAAWNAAIPTAIATVKTAKALADPLTKNGRERIAGRVLDRFATDMSKVRGATGGKSLSGTLPTLAEETGDLGIANLQNILQSRDPRMLLANRYADNNAARIGALDALGGTDEKLATALARRKAIGGKAYDLANAAGVDEGMANALKPQIENLLSRPSVKSAVDAAKRKAADEGIALTDLGSPQGLKYIKQEIDDLALSAPKGSNNARIYGQISSDLDSVMREIVPDIKRADAIYKRLSREPNRMQTARELQSETTSALRDFNGDPSLYAAKYAKTLDRGAERVVKEATGMKRKTLDNIFSEKEMKMLEDIRNTAERQAAAQRPRVSGSPTAKNLIGDDIVANIAGPLGVPKSWAQSVIAENLLSRPATWALKSSEERLNDVLLKGLLDPSYAAQLAAKSNPSLLSLRTAKFLENSSPVTQGLLNGYSKLPK
jgi:hypothetical protein